MKCTWRYFKFVGKKKGMSFSECLKREWKMQKQLVSFNESQKALNEKYKKEQAERFANCAIATPSKEYNDLNIPSSAFYSNSKGYMGSQYCGD
jgi:hypothetical protein